MKRSILYALVCFLSLTLSHAKDRPTGQSTPEGVACDAVQAYADRNSEAWLATLVRPIYGEDRNKEYAEFKKHMVKQTEASKKQKDFVAPQITRVFKARNFSMNGPGSLAYAIHEMPGNMFVDLEIKVDAETESLRYHVLQDKDKKWYFEPRPDLDEFLCMGLNKESPSKEILWELMNQKN